MQNISKTENVIVQSGEFFKISGCYQYIKHVIKDEYNECFIPDQSYRMLFSVGEKAPLLGSCVHAILWKLIYSK